MSACICIVPVFVVHYLDGRIGLVVFPLLGTFVLIQFSFCSFAAAGQVSAGALMRGSLYQVCTTCGEYPACFSLLRLLTLACSGVSQADCARGTSRDEAPIRLRGAATQY